MPELPEVETIRLGLEKFLTGATLREPEVLHPRASRHSEAGPAGLAAALDEALVTAVKRRGKYMWLELATPEDFAADKAPNSNTAGIDASDQETRPRALAPASSATSQQCVVIHLGMSGQVLIKPEGAERGKHCRIALKLDGPEVSGQELHFVDQRTFGYFREDIIDPSTGVPSSIAHIAPDLLEPGLDLEELARKISGRGQKLKNVLLNQEIVSGIGNIYADEMLWESQLLDIQPANALPLEKIEELLRAGQKVMKNAIKVGGTSFDDLYVNVNGESGYFAISLHAYGRQGTPCDRCGATMQRKKFVNRSSHFCEKCQTLLLK